MKGSSTASRIPWLYWIKIACTVDSYLMRNLFVLTCSLFCQSRSQLCKTGCAKQRGSIPMLPHYVKMQYLHLRFYANYFLLPWKIPEEISRQFSSITKGSIYHMKHVHTTFYHSSGLTRNCLMEVSIMFYVCRYCIFT